MTTKGGLHQAPFRQLPARVKVCGAERVSTAGAPFAAALIEAAPERVLWGTDWPHPNISGDMPNDGDLVDLFAQFTADEELRRQVLVENPTRLYRA